MEYKRSFRAALERLRLLYDRRATDRIFAAFETPSATLDRFTREYEAGFCDYPDPRARAAFWDGHLAERSAIEDDSIPSAYLSEFDQGLYGGVLGGDVRFLAHPENGWISSMVPPLLEDWSGFDNLRLAEDSVWLRRYREQLDVFVEQARGRFGISHFILIDGLNFVFELVGASRTYLSLADCPDIVRRAIDLAFEVNVRVQEMFFAAVPSFEGGTCSNMAQWLPGRIVSESVDPFHMTSVKCFETWGREPVQRIFDRFDGGVLHLHGNGRHLLEPVLTLRNLKTILLNDDRGYQPAWELLPEFRKRARDLPLVVFIPFEDFAAGLNGHTLTGGVLYKVKNTPSVSEANRLMEKVREYRA